MRVSRQRAPLRSETARVVMVAVSLFVLIGCVAMLRLLA